MRKIKNSKKGFTLLELLVVVLIIGILAGIALPQYKKIILKANLHKGIPLVESLYQAQQSYYLVNGAFAKNITNLDISLPDGCTETVTNINYSYDCSFGTVRSDGGPNIYFIFPNVSEPKIAYVKYFEDFYFSLAKVTFKASKRYCFAYYANNTAQDICQDMGGVYFGEYTNNWKYYELK